MRAVSGGLLFGIPLLYTMEVWWVGTYTEPSRVLGVLLLTFVPVWFLNRTSGFRSSKDVRLLDSLMDSIETVALGVGHRRGAAGAAARRSRSTRRSTKPSARSRSRRCLSASASRWRSTSCAAAAPKATTVPRRRMTTTRARDGGRHRRNRHRRRLHRVQHRADRRGADDRQRARAVLAPPVMLVSLAVSFCIVFVAGFSNEEQRRTQAGIFQHPISETVACYLVALVALRRDAVVLPAARRVGAVAGDAEPHHRAGSAGVGRRRGGKVGDDEQDTAKKPGERHAHRASGRRSRSPW